MKKDEFDNDDGFLFVPQLCIHPYDEATIHHVFDEQVNTYSEKVIKDREELKILKRLAFIELLICVPKYLLVLIFLNRVEARHYKEVIKNMYGLLFNKIDVNKYKSFLKE